MTVKITKITFRNSFSVSHKLHINNTSWLPQHLLTLSSIHVTIHVPAIKLVTRLSHTETSHDTWIKQLKWLFRWLCLHDCVYMTVFTWMICYLCFSPWRNVHVKITVNSRRNYAKYFRHSAYYLCSYNS